MTTAVRTGARPAGGVDRSPLETDPQRLERLRHVTANYRCMQGLRMVPFGLYLVLGALLKTVWRPSWGFLAEPIPELLGIILALVASWRIAAYYKRTYGDVQSLPRTTPWIVGYGAACGLVLLGLLADAFLALPVSGFALAIAVLMVVYWRVTGSFQTHYLWGAGVVAITALAAVPLQELARPYVASRLPSLTIYLAIVGIAYAVAGIVDHRNLVSILGRPEE
jgi:hypothetical protein